MLVGAVQETTDWLSAFEVALGLVGADGVFGVPTTIEFEVAGSLGPNALVSTIVQV